MYKLQIHQYKSLKIVRLQQVEKTIEIKFMVITGSGSGLVLDGKKPLPEPMFSLYTDIILSVMVSLVTGVSIVYSTVCSGADQRKHQSSASLAFVGNPPVTDGFTSQRASNVENVSISWRHHAINIDIQYHLLVGSKRLRYQYPPYLPGIYASSFRKPKENIINWEKSTGIIEEQIG